MTYQNIGWINRGGCQISTDTTKFDSNYVDHAYQLTANTRSINYLNTDKAEAWFHFDIKADSALGTVHDNELLRIVDDGGEVVLRWQFLNGVGTFYYDIGAGDVSLGTETYDSNEVQNIYDIHIVLHGTTGVIRVYKGGSMILEFTGDTIGSLTGRLINHIQFRGNYANAPFVNSDPFLSEFCIAYDGDSTLNKRIYYKSPTGNGTNTDWTGDYTDVDGDTPEGGIETSADAQTETFTFPALPGSGAVAAMAVVALGASGGGIEYDHAVRVSGTIYEGAAVPAIDGVSQMREYVWTANPDTAGGLTTTDIDAMEFGFVSNTA